MLVAFPFNLFLIYVIFLYRKPTMSDSEDDFASADEGEVEKTVGKLGVKKSSVSLTSINLSHLEWQF